MEVNTDMKNALRGCYTCVPGCYSNSKRDKELSFSQVSNVLPAVMMTFNSILVPR